MFWPAIYRSRSAPRFFKRAKKIYRLAKTARTFFVRAVSVSIINQLKLWIVSACLHTLTKSCGHFPLCIY